MVQVGTNASGNPTLRNRVYRNVNTQALDADVHDVGVALAGLQTYPVSSITRSNELDLVVS